MAHSYFCGAYRHTLSGPSDIFRIIFSDHHLVGARRDTGPIGRTHDIVREETTARQTSLLVRLHGPLVDPSWAVQEPNLEELVRGYMSQNYARRGISAESVQLSSIGVDR